VNKSEITTRVGQIIVEHLGVSPADVQPGTRLVPENDGSGRRVMPPSVPDLGADSLDIVELTMAFEEEFGIEIPDDESQRFNEMTVEEVIDQLERLGA